MSQQPPPLEPTATYGRLLRSVRAGPFQVSLTLHAAGLALQRHAHASATASVVLWGDYEEWTDSARDVIPPLGVTIKPGGILHENRIGRRGARSLVIALDRECELDDDPSLRWFAEPRVIGLTPATELTPRIVRVLGRPEDALTPFALETLLIEWIGLAERTEQPSRQIRAAGWLLRVEGWVRETHVRDLRLSDLAREAGHHPSYVVRAFRRAFGQSIGAYARSLRVAGVVRALASSSSSISTIAHEKGYCDHGHMTHEFVRHTGLTPSGWRHAVQGDWSRMR